jgi:hypothetical protein
VARASVWERVLELRDEGDMTVLLTAHYLEEAERLCDRVGLLLDGRLRAIGRPSELEAALGPGATLEDVFRAYVTDAAEEDKGACAMSAVPDARPAGSAEAAPTIGAIRLLWRRTATLSLLELAKLRHDRTELYTRAVQPALWLLLFGETFSRTTPSRPRAGSPTSTTWRPGSWPSRRCSSRSSTGSSSSGSATSAS